MFRQSDYHPGDLIKEAAYRLEILIGQISKIQRHVQMGLSFGHRPMRVIEKVRKLFIRPPTKPLSNICHYRKTDERLIWSRRPKFLEKAPSTDIR
jgi:hypothetical protein